MPHVQLRLDLLAPEEIQFTAIHFLREGNEEEEARLLSSCSLEMGEVRPRDSRVREIDIILRCTRKVAEKLKALKAERECPKSLGRIREAVEMALPGDFVVGLLVPRSAGTRLVFPSVGAPPVPSVPEVPSAQTPPTPAGVMPRASDCLFKKVGETWKVRFAGMVPFHLRDCLGVRYLDHLLHRPNEAISAFDLEALVRPEKAHARPRDSIQRQEDPQAVKEYLRELNRLRAQGDAAQESGNLVEARQIEAELDALEAELTPRASAADTGERARNNVRKAIGVVLRKLLRGTPAQRAFAEHAQIFVNLGYKCFYSHPGGKVWE